MEQSFYDEEKTGLVKTLNSYREHVLTIVEGLNEEQLRQPVLASGWTCLGMVRHLTNDDERFWFRGIMAGEPMELGDTSEANWRVETTETSNAVFDAYRHEISLANAITDVTPLDAAPAVWPDDLWPTWRLRNFREVLLHVITETVCHVGHLEAVRELLDGRTFS